MKRNYNNTHVQVCESNKKTQKQPYRFLALLSAALLFAGMLFIERSAAFGLGLLFCFCLACCGLLLLCLMKLNVMEFPAGSFWDRVNRQVSGTAQAQIRPVSSGAVCVRPAGRGREAAGVCGSCWDGYRNAA